MHHVRPVFGSFKLRMGIREARGSRECSPAGWKLVQ